MMRGTDYLIVVICWLKDDASGHWSVGVGRTQPKALEDAIINFDDRPPELIRGRIKRGIATATYFDRQLSWNGG